MGKGIYFKEDIIEEMAKEFAIPEKELKEIVDMNLAYIKKNVKEKPLLLISLPNLAKLRFNLKLGMSSNYTLRNRSSLVSKTKAALVQEKVDALNEFRYQKKLINFQKPLFERLYKKITKEKRVRQLYNTMYHSWAAIEKKSNELLEKIK